MMMNSVMSRRRASSGRNRISAAPRIRSWRCSSWSERADRAATRRARHSNSCGDPRDSSSAALPEVAIDSHVFIISKFQRGQVLDVRRLPGAVERDDEGQADRDFRRRHGDDEKHEHLAVVVGQARRITLKREKATSARLAALSISSSDMKMTMMLRRRITPAKPRAKSSPLTRR